MKTRLFIIILACLALFYPVYVRAEEQKAKTFEAVELSTGFNWGKIRIKGNYNLIPLIVDFDLDLKPLAEKLNLHPNTLLQLQIEPFASFVTEPESNFEAGTAFFFKFGILPQSSKFQPYGKFGTGMLFMSEHTKEQGTQFNFIDQAGLGMHYFFNKNTALTFEYRRRHISNLGIKKPNSGINGNTFTTGICWQF